MVRKFQTKNRCILYYVGERICHQLKVEKGHVAPGDLVVDGDSYTCTCSEKGYIRNSCGSRSNHSTSRVWMVLRCL